MSVAIPIFFANARNVMPQLSEGAFKARVLYRLRRGTTVEIEITNPTPYVSVAVMLDLHPDIETPESATSIWRYIAR